MENENIIGQLGKIITNYRENHHPKLSSRDFADKCGISKSIIYSIEANTYNSFLCQTTLYKISKGLGLKDDLELLTLIEHANNSQNKKSSDENIITLHPKTRLYALFRILENYSDEQIEVLHNIALHLK